MRALVRSGGTVSLERVATPTPGDGEALVRVIRAGLCRTDCEVASGRLEIREPLILGHEFSGVVEATPQGASFAPGARVACMPFVPCGSCARCQIGAGCLAKRQLGVERDGAFAEFVSVPLMCLEPLPDPLDFTVGAFAEPIAAAMAVLELGLPGQAPGLVLGSGRIAELVFRVMLAAGFERIRLAALDEQLERDAYEFCVETHANSQLIAKALEALAPEGTLVLKSRSQRPVELNIGLCVKKRLRLLSADYGDMALGLRWVAEGRLEVRDLFAAEEPLEAFSEVFQRAAESEHQKLFFKLTPG
ncbi:MAG: alcohol dehydrogenase catalytic domain-containing protein [Myxococcales bacterium]|nr:alcohol dehydrogenase catalytic domain-containing protein [Myxococcales bacterium]